jgi:hypothetical protein
MVISKNNHLFMMATMYWMESSYWFGSRLDKTSSKNDFCYMSLSDPFGTMVLRGCMVFMGIKIQFAPQQTTFTLQWHHIFPKQLVPPAETHYLQCGSHLVLSSELSGFLRIFLCIKRSWETSKRATTWALVWPPGMRLENHTHAAGWL